MNRREFEALRDLPEKTILDDIRFSPSRPNSRTLTFDQVKVHNNLGVDLLVNGSFVPDIPSIKFNFRVLAEGGAICRVEVNGVVHKPVGRTHKHALQDESCPRKNIPHAVARPDLDLDSLTPRQIWEKVCREANIIHEGDFIDPV